ncbi:Polysaccharide biosynthesis protein WlaX [uncultured Candidatus Thioglobus sp.]|nr:Polysaccharide biosynthesis protein WlaX [uncultured Candidatus Thioglobus sp.]
MSLGDIHASEADIVQTFFDLIERYTPKLIAWNGGSFDLPVLHYRALLHKINAQRYWETGEDDQSFKWNNYLSRFHSRHTDLMDVLSGYNPRAFAPLTEIARILGLSGKIGMDGSQIWAKYLAGEIEAIRNYCETDVLNTYLVYLNYEIMSGYRSLHLTLDFESKLPLVD